MNLKAFEEYRDKVLENCAQVIVGKDEILLKVLVCCLCSGHILLEDVPGTGKTMLLRAFARTVGGSFRRIQFTPDVMPSDLTGIHFYHQKTGEFEFRPGPVFANMVLADEINRATPRTQSSLLEAMAEGQVTVDGTTYPLSQPFMVMATQNPLESYGTFPLPEAQTDRFFMRLSLGYMSRQDELSVLRREDTMKRLEMLTQTVTPEETMTLRAAVSEVEVSGELENYLMDIIELTRRDNRILLGASTRGALALYHASQALAALKGRDYVVPEDITELAPDVLCHRMTFRTAPRMPEQMELLRRMTAEIPVPMEQREV